MPEDDKELARKIFLAQVKIKVEGPRRPPACIERVGGHAVKWMAISLVHKKRRATFSFWVHKPDDVFTDSHRLEILEMLTDLLSNPMERETWENPSAHDKWWNKRDNRDRAALRRLFGEDLDMMLELFG
jgi:hypothetical protein